MPSHEGQALICDKVVHEDIYRFWKKWGDIGAVSHFQ